MRNSSFLIVGPLPSLKFRNFGGTTILMQNFKDYLDYHHVGYVFFNTVLFCNPKLKVINPLLNFLHLVISFIPKLIRCKVVFFNFSNRGFINILPGLVFLSAFFKKKIVLRKFAGSMELFWEELPNKKRQKLIEMCLASDLIFMETKSGIEFLTKLVGDRTKVVWFPNVRKPSPFVKQANYIQPRRFAFISLVTRTKGVDELLQAFHNLDYGYSLDIYGKLTSDYQETDLNSSNVRYLGELDSTSVRNTLKQYDMLILPSYSEGYPGIILESFSIGVPVIATRVGGIPEVVMDGYNGVLVDPKSSVQLCDAILSISPIVYMKLCTNSISSFNTSFNSDVVNANVLSNILAI